MNFKHITGKISMWIVENRRESPFLFCFDRYGQSMAHKAHLHHTLVRSTAIWCLVSVEPETMAPWKVFWSSAFNPGRSSAYRFSKLRQLRCPGLHDTVHPHRPPRTRCRTARDPVVGWRSPVVPPETGLNLNLKSLDPKLTWKQQIRLFGTRLPRYFIRAFLGFLAQVQTNGMCHNPTICCLSQSYPVLPKFLPLVCWKHSHVPEVFSTLRACKRKRFAMASFFSVV